MSSYSEGQTHQLMNALEAAGFTAQDITRLGQFKNLGGIREVLGGRAEMVVIKHFIDLDADPTIPDGWKVYEHLHNGRFMWDVSKVALHCMPLQQGKRLIHGIKLYHSLKSLTVLNANVLDYLLANPNLIPDGWKVKRVFFWGTIYYNSEDVLFVRCLSWNGNQWNSNSCCIGNEWGCDDPAAVLIH